MVRSPVRKFVIYHPWTPSMGSPMSWKCFKCLISAVVPPWTLYWGDNSGPPEPIAGFTGAHFWPNTSLSLTKNNVVFSLGQTDGHCYHDSLKYRLPVPKTSSWMEKCTKFGHFILRKIIENCCHQMSYFEAKMHQIRFRLGLHPRPRWGSLQRSLRPPSWNWGGLLLRGGEGRGVLPNENPAYAIGTKPELFV